MKIINLGPNCKIAGILKQYNILKERSPFDSIITEHESLINCLNDNFTHFTNEEFFTLYFDKNSPINKYNIVLAHNFSLESFDYDNLNKSNYVNKVKELTNLNIKDINHSYEFYTINKNNILNNFKCSGILNKNWSGHELNILKEKYNRRINRFKEYMNSTDEVLLFREVSNINEAIEIKNCLLQNFSNRNFKLIFFTYNNNLKFFKHEIDDNFLLGYNYCFQHDSISEDRFYSNTFFDILYNNKKNQFFQNTINNLNNNLASNMKQLINPLSMYLLANYYYGEELERSDIFNINNSNDIFINKNISKREDFSFINDYDIIAIQGGPSNGTDWKYNFYDLFCKNVLPKINKKIILIIGHYSLTHFINFDDNINKILNNDNVVLCFFQNNGMVRELLNYKKIKFFPFGLSLNKDSIISYINLLVDIYKNNKKIEKIKNIEHLHLGMSWDGRKKFPVIPREHPNIFFKKMAASKFLLSPCGDRWDCYRHYECIGLETIPICHKGSLTNIFFDSMYYICDNDNGNGEIFGSYFIDTLDNLNDDKKIDYMISLFNNNDYLKNNYKKPNKDLITFEYWKFYLDTIINMYKK